MSSKRRRQKAAARAIGKEIQGPVTPEPASSDRLAHSVCLRSENRAEFTKLYARLVAEHAPATPTEHFTIEEMAVCRWRLHRAWTMETALLDNQSDHMRDEIAKTYEKTDEATRAALAYRKLTEGSHALPLLLRQQNQLARQFDRCLKRLTTLRAGEKQELPVDPSPKNEHHATQLPSHQPRAAQPAPDLQRQPSAALAPPESQLAHLRPQTRPHDSEQIPGPPSDLPRAA